MLVFDSKDFTDLKYGGRTDMDLKLNFTTLLTISNNSESDF